MVHRPRVHRRADLGPDDAAGLFVHAAGRRQLRRPGLHGLQGHVADRPRGEGQGAAQGSGLRPGQAAEGRDPLQHDGQQPQHRRSPSPSSGSRSASRPRSSTPTARRTSRICATAATSTSPATAGSPTSRTRRTSCSCSQSDNKGFNYGKYNNPEFDGLLKQAATELDLKKRAEIMQQGRGDPHEGHAVDPGHVLRQEPPDLAEDRGLRAEHRAASIRRASCRRRSKPTATGRPACPGRPRSRDVAAGLAPHGGASCSPSSFAGFLSAIPTLFLIVTISFFLIRLAPGGPFDLERPLEAKVMENLQPDLQARPAALSSNTCSISARSLRGDFGPSFILRDFSVAELFARGLPVSMTLGALALLLAILVGGTLGAHRRLPPEQRRRLRS